jgi:hypothetical protein
MARTRTKLTKDEIAEIYKGLEKAKLGGYKIAALHLRPRHRSVGAAAAGDDSACHSVQLPNGHFILICE